MEKPSETPKSLSDIKAKPPNVEVTREPTDEADIAATKALIELYTDKDGFHCPRCPFTTSNPEEAVYHLAEEINKCLAHLNRPSK